MAIDDRHDEDAGGPDEGLEREPGPAGDSVLGNLPRTRPGSRSPRRRARPAGGEDASAEGSASPQDAAAQDAPGESEGGGIEDLAWAGVAIAAEAATLGVKLANRMLEAGSGWQRRER